MDEEIEFRLTQYSHGAGCGCKISPQILDEILSSNLALPDNNKLLVGNHTKDDAAVYDIGNGMGLISTTDFFMPIVDDPFDFGKIASANAISDIYAMGGKPIMAIAILGWPIEKIPAKIAKRVIEGSRSICKEAGIPLAGGHSIDSPEPIFGLAVNGLVPIANIKKNNSAKVGDHLLLTKPLGVGILTTAEKRGILKTEHLSLAKKQMVQLNSVGVQLGNVTSVNAMTDITGFGLLGHLVEMCEGSSVGAVIDYKNIPFITDDLYSYLEQDCIPGGTKRNLSSYGRKIEFSTEADTSFQKYILADPQTSGGLLISVPEEALTHVHNLLSDAGIINFTKTIGRITKDRRIVIKN